MKNIKIIETENIKMTDFSNAPQSEIDRFSALADDGQNMYFDIGEIVEEKRLKGVKLKLFGFSEERDPITNELLYYYKIKPTEGENVGLIKGHYFYLLINQDKGYSTMMIRLDQHMDSISKHTGQGIIIDMTQMLIFTDIKVSIQEMAAAILSNPELMRKMRPFNYVLV